MSKRGTLVERATQSIEKGTQGAEGPQGACPNIGAC
jgi:hypothetical protein